MQASPLRQLVKRYASGNLRRSDYLNQRKALLKAFTSGAQTIKYRDNRPIVFVPNTRWVQPLVLGTIGGLILVTVIVVLSLDNDSNQMAATATSPSISTPATKVASPVGAGGSLLQRFLRAPDWSLSKLDEFAQNWRKLSAFERETARRSLWHRRLNAEIQQKLNELTTLQAITIDPQRALQQKKLEQILQQLNKN